MLGCAVWIWGLVAFPASTALPAWFHLSHVRKYLVPCKAWDSPTVQQVVPQPEGMLLWLNTTESQQT